MRARDRSLPGQRPGGRSRGRIRAARVALALVPLLVLLLLGEVGVRLARGELLDTGPAQTPHADLLRDYPARHHPTLGWVPAPGLPGVPGAPGALGDARHPVIDGDELRANGPEPRPHGGAVLAVGDSFTFGDGVADTDTWPAVLERRLGRPVLNAGVFGYGFDQTVLRAEELVPRLRPALLLVSLIPDDVRRCGYSCRYADKPWFVPRDGALELHGVPVPPPPDEPGPLRAALAHSRLADALLGRVAPHWWLRRVRPVRAHDQHLAVARLLVDRIAELSRREQVPVLLVLQAGLTSNTTLVQPVLQRASELRLPVLNLVPRLREAIDADPTLRERWFAGHMTAAGNAWVAEQVAGYVR